MDFYNYDGKTLLLRIVFYEGDEIIYDGETPIRPNTNKSTYLFSGWRNQSGQVIDSLGVASGNYVKFYAYYTEVLNVYNITWIVDDVIITEVYEYGAIPSYTGKPAKPDTEQYTYKFMGWDTPISVVEEDAVYEARFEAIIKQYTVEWHFGETVYTEIYNYGEIPSFKGRMLDFADDEYIYSFLGWDKEITSVNGNTVYTAEFDRKAIADDGEGNVIRVEESNYSYNVSVPANTVCVDNLLNLAEANDSSINLAFDSVGVDIILNEVLVSDMIQSDCKYIYIYLNEEIARSRFGRGTRYSVRFVNSEGDDVDLENGVTIQFKDNVKAETRVYVINSDGVETAKAHSYNDGILSVKLNRSEDLVLKNNYRIDIEENENATVLLDIMSANAGDTVVVKLWFTDDYMLNFIKVIGNETGIEYSIDGEDEFTFIMPEEAVTISTVLELKEYVIKFVVDGVVISEKKYHKGEEIVLPEPPTKEGNDDKEFLFVGWSPTVTIVNGDKTYVAEFREKILGEENYGGDRGEFYLRVGIASALAVAALTSVVVIIIRRKKKNKKQ